MLQRMKALASEGKNREALIIGQNLFSHNSGDPEIFGTYFTVLWAITSNADSVEEKQNYFQQLSAIMAAFSEAVTLDDSMIAYIKAKEDSLSLLFDEIQNARLQQQKALLKEKVLHNDKVLKQAEGILAKLEAASDKQPFDELLEQLLQCDERFAKDYLTDRQKRQYEAMTKKCSGVVDSKVRRFEHNKDVEYNQKALDAYEKVFLLFKQGTTTDNHMAIIRGLFEYDASRLFNETLTYYNYVYSYVLSKMDDSEKFLLTKAAVQAQTRR